jgi:PRTRC genetic system protein A
MNVDPRSAALLASCPCVAVPPFGPLDDMPLGQRTLVARNGVFTQVRLPWLDCVVQIAELPVAPPLPYGPFDERIAFRFEVIPVALLAEFIGHGRAALPNEIAGGLIYHAGTNALRLQVYDALEAGPGGVRYRMPMLAADESIAVDLHTHGRLRAFWSSTDDADDRGVKVCGVFGTLHDQPTAAFRLVVNGFYKALRHPWERLRGAPAVLVDAHDPCPTLSSMGFMEGCEWSI